MKAFQRTAILLGWAMLLSPHALPSAEPGHPQTSRPFRARDLGIILGNQPPGRWNAITDVPGVRVGHRTLIRGRRIRTGVTVILPHSGNLFREKVPAAAVVGNGFGKFVGFTQIEELGEIETPIVLTNTLSVFRAADGLLDFMLAFPGNERVRSINPVVAECNDGWLNDIRARAVTSRDVLEALKTARSGPVPEGSVGAGTGMMALGWKGGVGTASRVVAWSRRTWTLGVLVLANFGGALRIDGVAVPPAAGDPRRKLSSPVPGGSVIIVVATDAPMDSQALRRLARRTFAGIARAGSTLSHGSGDYAVAFSTHPAMRHPGPPVGAVRPLAGRELNPFFAAAIEATEEAVVNALLRARTVLGRDGHIGVALPYTLVLSLGEKAGKRWALPAT